ncbi:conjugative transfer system coupling protein TraD [uncultured Thiobacillus sp.]|uniref:conjugative transfer system coupling protein TraD n=1 Tax=uncultured Thiobacillus sp. TaxID=189996 RepID=UPI0026140B67|nr:conjugative transfer system coupling protein TraD [uncultured Thiobacillus sp.]
MQPSFLAIIEHRVMAVSSPYDFEVPWRPNFEAKMAMIWAVGSSLIILVSLAVPMFSQFAALLAIGCALAAAYRGYQAYKRLVDASRLKLFGKEFIDLAELERKAGLSAKQKAFWLGKGFPWTDIEATKLHTLISLGVVRTIGKAAQHTEGAYWIHGLAPESDLYSELSHLVGHTLIVGTTRVGKTRLFDLLIAQAIFRGETVIIIDPKGDHGLAQNARAACEACGAGDRFVYFHPAHPDRSACIDPLRNWNRKTELASRVAALIPSETGADPFTAFGWKVLNDITNGMIATGHRPNLVQLRRYVEGGPESLLQRALKVHFSAHVKDWESRAASYIKRYKDRLLEAYITFYQEIAIHEAQSVDLDGLISTYEHNRDHFQKMVASLIPILSMLTSDPLQELLSPDFEPGHERLVTDMSKIIRGNKVVYIGLDSLADSTVGSAIGSIMLADLAAVAGDRYNYGIDSLTPVNLFIDEAAEVLNQPAIQLMNKGGGADFRVTIATQTFADFASRLGDENKARQVLANTNNKIALRVLDSETQKYIAEGMPEIKVRSMALRYGHNVDTHIHDEYTASYQEQILEEDAELFPAAMLGELPPLHFIARLSGGRTLKGRIPILLTEQ